ncbi:DEAD/DEAH box helicase [Alkalibacillus haloalkaliphilus]|uniref:DEAD/DEAH box helicase n=1 Tax=Alkalibacillus haloalkaliphilus TaxID=94136 RepID=UPI00293557A4|nr:SNF2-related protein [Alkalibacillus haloalkaliphilus]MDV2580971.1 SNF2-related protein [Alkalibacillus haloalkaliphilus]
MKPIVNTDHLYEVISHVQDYQNSDWDTFKKAYELSQLSMTNKNELNSLKYLPNLELLPHQREAVEKVIFHMHGRAILADEVGLGKTIEAGVILKELMIKGLVKKVLILVPSSLIRQWESEMNYTFFIPARAKHRSYPWEVYDIVISSIDLAKKEPHASTLIEQEFDLLIVDEAHRLKNADTKNYQFVKQLKSTYCLLLTATPIQNKIDEVYHLMKIVRPGLLGDKRIFKEKVKKSSYDTIQTLIKQSMVRSRKSDVQDPWAAREIKTIQVDFTEEEQHVYEELQQLETSHALTNLTLSREFCSSREACYLSMKKQENLKESHIIELIEQLPNHAKALKTMDLIKEIDDKVIIFTEYKSSQLYLQWLCQQNGISAVPYNGDFRKSKKQWMLQLFQNNAKVLIATDAGAEGLNLQFCKNMIHYDLPWNPMKLEQRIGRIHRFGQKDTVNIFYVVLNNTMDERILNLLYDKLSVFEGVIGEIDQILSSFGANSFEEEITDIIQESHSTKEAEIKIDNLMSVIQSESENSEGELKDETS